MVNNVFSVIFLGKFEHIQLTSLVFLCLNVNMLLPGGLPLGKRIMLYTLQSMKLKLGNFVGKYIM